MSQRTPWTLILRPDGAHAIRATLTDSSWSSCEGIVAWPDAQGPAWPPAFAPALAAMQGARLRLQLPVALDAVPWEAHLLPLLERACVIPRFLVDLEAGDAPSDLPANRHVIAQSDDRARLAVVRAARASGRAVILLGADVPAWKVEVLNQAVRHHWSEAVTMSQALEAGLASVGIALGDCRLYGDATEPASGLAKGRRPITAVHIDLAGSTRMQQGIGNEAYADRHRQFHECCSEVVSRLQGSLDQPQGDDSFMAYFGFPKAVEDGASRALHAAWQMSRRLVEVGLHAHVGVASGVVVISANQPFADELNLAARLGQLGRPGEVLVAASTFVRVAPSFNLRLDEGREVPDFPNEPVYVLDSTAPIETDRRSLRTAPTALVGRTDELLQLREAWRLARTGRLQWLTVKGEAGIGKSRLLGEFARELIDRHERCLRMTGQAHAANSPFAAVADALRGFCSIQSSMSIESVRARIAANVGHVLDGEHDVRDLGELLSPERSDPAAGIGAQPRWLELLLKCLAAFSAAGPACLIVDDAHWLDPSSHELLARLRFACQASPLLVLLGQRSELLAEDRSPASEVIALRGLDAAESEELARLLAADLPQEVRHRMVERSEGIPLYLEESLRAVRTRGGDADLPALLQDLLAVRLDELGQDLPIAQIVSLLGRDVSAADAHALLAADDPFIVGAVRQGSLRSLVRSGLVQATADAVPGYRFKHALIRNAAYQSLRKDDRRRLHGICADLIERNTPQARQQRPELRASHLEDGDRLAEALLAWLSAARLASTRHAHRESLEFCAKGLRLCDLLPADADRAALRTQLHLLQAPAHMALEGYGSDQVEAAYRAAEASCALLGDARQMVRVRLGLEACFVARGDLVKASELAVAAVAATAWDEHPRLALQARWALANVRFHQGDWRAALAGFDECLARYVTDMHSPAGVQDPAIMCLGYSSWIQFEIGQADEALDRIDRMLALAEELDHPFSRAVAYGFAASIVRLCGSDLELATRHAEEAVRICMRGGYQTWLAHAWMVHGQLLMDRGELERGAHELERGHRQWFGASRLSCGTYLATLAEILLRRGLADVASGHLDEAARITESIGERHYHAELFRLQGLCDWQHGKLDAASTGLWMAWHEARLHGRRGLELRCALSLGALEASLGRFADALSRLEPLAASLPRHARSRDLRWANRALDSWRAGRVFESNPSVPWEPLGAGL